MKDEFGRLPKTMGKDLTDLFPRGDHPDKRSSEGWLKDLEERKKCKPVKRYPIRRMN